MVSMEDIKAINLLAGLTDQMREKIRPIAELRQFKEREVVYQEGDKAEYFYMLKRGKILLEVEILLLSIKNMKLSID